MTASNNWYVLTGSPSSGKSTLIGELAKLGYATIEEQGRRLIDQELARGKTLAQIDVDSAAFEVAWTKFQEQRESQAAATELTFLDRGRLDTLAYFNYYGWPVPPAVSRLCSAASYRKVFWLEQLDYEQDYARVETADTAHAMQELFAEAYLAAGYEVIRLPVMSIADRLELLLRHID